MKNSVSMLVLVALSVVVILVLVPEPASAICCHSNSHRQCGDCGKSSSHCGLRDCNVFGCNCDPDNNGDICRFGSCFIPPANNNRVTGKDVVLSNDRNRDGVMSVEEARRVLARNNLRYKRSAIDARDAFDSLDANKDGVLTAEEID